MNKVVMSAGIVILVGLGTMMVFTAMYYVASNDYYDTLATGRTSDVVDAGKRLNLYDMVYSFGLIVAGIGVAILAFGLASNGRKGVEFRQVETPVPAIQYPQEQYPPPSPPQG